MGDRTCYIYDMLVRILILYYRIRKGTVNITCNAFTNKCRYHLTLFYRKCFKCARKQKILETNQVKIHILGGSVHDHIAASF